MHWRVVYPVSALVCRQSAGVLYRCLILGGEGAASDSDLLESSASDILSDSFTYRRAHTRLVDVGLPIYQQQNIGCNHPHRHTRSPTRRATSYKDVSHKSSRNALYSFDAKAPCFLAAIRSQFFTRRESIERRCTYRVPLRALNKECSR